MNLRKKLGPTSFRILIFVLCLIVIVALIFVGQIFSHAGVPREEFRMGIIKIGDELGFEPLDVTTISFDPADLPFFDRLIWKMNHRHDEQKIQVILENQNPLLEYSFTNKNGADVRVDAYESSNQVFLVTIHDRFKTETIKDWNSNLRRDFPSLRIVQK